MGLTYYNMEMLARMMHRQKVVTGLKKSRNGRLRNRMRAARRNPETCRIRPTGVFAK